MIVLIPSKRPTTLSDLTGTAALDLRRGGPCSVAKFSSCRVDTGFWLAYLSAVSTRHTWV